MTLFWFIFGTFLWLLGAWMVAESYERFFQKKKDPVSRVDEEFAVGLVAAFWPFAFPYLALVWLAYKTGKFLLDWGEAIVRAILKERRTNGTGPL